MKRYSWSHLNKQQVGAYAEYFVKMELTMYGFQVFGAEVDDRGIDFLARSELGEIVEVQVKSLRGPGYIFAQKSKFALRRGLYLAVVLFEEGRLPDVFMVPSSVWENPNNVFVGRDYTGLKSKPEWGINLSAPNISALQPFRIEAFAYRQAAPAAN